MPKEEEPSDHQPHGHRPHEQAESRRRVGHLITTAISASSLTAIKDALPGLADFLRAAAVVAIVIFVFLKWSFVAAWLDSISHFEGFGAKIDRTAQQLDSMAKASAKKSIPFDVPFAQLALAQAEAVSPALVGARLLWVDQHPENNTLLIKMFQSFGISVQLALNTTDAITFAKMEAPDSNEIFDLVIANQFRRDEKLRPRLERCPAAYFAFPDAGVRGEYGGDDPADLTAALGKYNAALQEHPPAGFGLAEEFAKTFPDQFEDTQRPRVILFAASSGGIAAGRCIRIVTSRYDVLLQSVISALVQFRGDLLPRPSQPSAPTPAQEAAALRGQADLIYETQRLAASAQPEHTSCAGTIVIGD
jgi:hypothetical protein